MSQNIKFMAVDIETAPTVDKGVMETLYKKLSPPKNYKDEEKIKEYMTDKLMETVDKTALNPLWGSIISIAIATNASTDVKYADGETSEYDIVSWAVKEMTSFMSSTSFNEGHMLTGHNVIEFDLPFIFKRAALLDVPTDGLISPSTKPWHVAERVYDTMLKWGKPFPRLKELAGQMGLLRGDEDDDTGADALQAWKDGDMERVATHNRNDAEVSLRLAYKMFAAGF